MRKQGLLLHRYSKKDYSEIIQKLNEKHGMPLLGRKALYVYSMDLLQNRLDHLEIVYPKNVLHAVAIKTNSLPEVLEYIVKNGNGLEAASFEEVRLAIKAGCPHDKIVFDSPAKTQSEIRTCDLNFKGIYVNANSLVELERFNGTCNLNIGIRINPLVDVKSPGIFNVSNKGSKFGIPITLKEEIKQYAFRIGNSVKGLHVHAGSEIGNIEGHVEAIGVVYDLAEEMNAEQKSKIQFLDIGGGFPAKMEEGEQPSLEPFVTALKKRCPRLFEDYQVITEYGRFVHAHNAFAISRVEYELDYYDPKILIVHLGADLFVREVYSSVPPHHDIHVFGEEGEIRNSPTEKYDIGGPLCFSGDFLARNVALPKVFIAEDRGIEYIGDDERIGDLILVADCGANTISMWSSHCSRERIQVVYYQKGAIKEERYEDSNG